MIFIERSRISWNTGEAQSPGLVIHKGEDLDLSETLDFRLVGSKKVEIILSWPDGGSALMNLTDRGHRFITSSPSATERINEFEAELKLGAGSRIFTFGLGLMLALWPLTAFIPAFFVTIFTDPATRRYIFTNGSASTPAPPIPHWADEYLRIIIYFWPAALVFAVTIAYTRIRSGGLRIRRNTEIQLSWLAFLYRLRSEGLRIDNWRPIFIGAISAAISALVTVWFSRK
jgi:hypothetical protein